MARWTLNQRNRRISALARFKIHPQAEGQDDKAYAKYKERKEVELAALKKALHHA